MEHTEHTKESKELFHEFFSDIDTILAGYFNTKKHQFDDLTLSNIGLHVLVENSVNWVLNFMEPTEDSIKDLSDNISHQITKILRLKIIARNGGTHVDA